VICPRCQSEHCRRSRRRSYKDFIVGFTGLRPWRCLSCSARFFARSVALAFAPYVHCRRCGNMNLERIARKSVPGHFAWFSRLARMRAYRCASCRYRFFSSRPYRHVMALEAAREKPAPKPASS